jgi:AAA domain, putative AbiEii toxin, Type IV TA system
VIPFSNGAGAADAIGTFHGDNGSGKSNAIAALELLLRAATMLPPKDRPKEVLFNWDQGDSSGFVALRRDRPSDARGATEISARFADARLGTVTLCMTPVGKGVALKVSGSAEAWGDATREERGGWLEAPLGPNSRPMAVLHASRRVSWSAQAPGEVIQPGLAEDLLGARLSRQPEQRTRWRDFEGALLAVPAFAGMDISIDRIYPNGPPELTFERRGKSVLGLDALSSGERQLVVLFAAVLLADAAIVVVEEPELSLDAKSQHLFRDFLARLVQQRRIDQAIIESHVPAFDGPQVIRFHRDPGGPTRVTRDPSETAAQAAIRRKAQEAKAEPRYVTRDGYTELPEVMRKDLGLTQGGGLWFLKGDRWEAWPEHDVDAMFGGGNPAESDRE